jgi:hypothetical protein
MAAMFIPFYAYGLIISDPRALIVQVFTYFPLTAPVTALLRNGFGTLIGLEAGIVIAELFIIGVLILRLAVHLYRYWSIEYGKKLCPSTSCCCSPGAGRKGQHEMPCDRQLAEVEIPGLRAVVSFSREPSGFSGCVDVSGPCPLLHQRRARACRRGCCRGQRWVEPKLPAMTRAGGGATVRARIPSG